ncbi:MAG: hypothetical protein HC876_20040 [Chloroflexaceae bacterium]|nr:hypothetical protein [Chloroflexaceae bacterium]
MGRLATFSATGLGVATGHDTLQQGLLEAVFRDEVATLGEATMAAKIDLFIEGRHEDLLNTFVILGDPALQLPAISTDDAPRLYLPLVRRLGA